MLELNSKVLQSFQRITAPDIFGQRTVRPSVDRRGIKQRLFIQFNAKVPTVITGKPLNGKPLERAVAIMRKQGRLDWFTEGNDRKTLQNAATLSLAIPMMKEMEARMDIQPKDMDLIKCDGKRILQVMEWPGENQQCLPVGWAWGTPYWNIVRSLCCISVDSGLFHNWLEDYMDVEHEMDLENIEENGGVRTDNEVWQQPGFKQRIEALCKAPSPKRYIKDVPKEFLSPLKGFLDLLAKYNKFRKGIELPELHGSGVDVSNDTDLFPVLWEQGVNDRINEYVDDHINNIWGNDTIVADWMIVEPGKKQRPYGLHSYKHELRTRLVTWIEQLRDHHLQVTSTST